MKKRVWSFSINQVPSGMFFPTKAQAEKAAKAEVRKQQAHWGWKYGRYYEATVRFF